MHFLSHSSLSLVILLACIRHGYCNQDFFTIHGSGTTNPSKCFWHIMSKIEDQSHSFTRLTYRAVGSGTGQTEFVGQGPEGQVPSPVNDFGSGDIPLSDEKYESLKKNGESTAIHLPFVVSGISFFHSVPNVPSGKGGLNLTSCLLAQIFDGQITEWDDQLILDENPNLKSMLGSNDFPITVAHRWEGSSSTKSITQYLNMRCGKYWPDEKVKKEGKLIEWAPGSLTCDSSGKMTACIRGKSGTIGYIDSGHGWEEGLTEIELKNAAGNFVSSLDSYNSGGTALAALEGLANINRYDENFADISLLDQLGENTWPILVMSYVYIRKNILDYVTADNAGLLKIFLKSIYEADYIDECKIFGFAPVSGSVRTKALAAIELVNFTGVDEWSFEVDIEKIAGQSPTKLASRRRTYAEYERSKLADDLESVRLENESLKKLMSVMENTQVDNQAMMSAQMEDLNNEMYDQVDSGKVNLAIGLGAASIALWCAAIVYLFVKKIVFNL